MEAQSDHTSTITESLILIPSPGERKYEIAKDKSLPIDFKSDSSTKWKSLAGFPPFPPTTVRLGVRIRRLLLPTTYISRALRDTTLLWIKVTSGIGGSWLAWINWLTMGRQRWTSFSISLLLRHWRLLLSILNLWSWGGLLRLLGSLPCEIWANRLCIRS